MKGFKRTNNQNDRDNAASDNANDRCKEVSNHGIDGTRNTTTRSHEYFFSRISFRRRNDQNSATADTRRAACKPWRYKHDQHEQHGGVVHSATIIALSSGCSQLNLTYFTLSSRIVRVLFRR